MFHLTLRVANFFRRGRGLCHFAAVYRFASFLFIVTLSRFNESFSPGKCSSFPVWVMKATSSNRRAVAGRFPQLFHNFLARLTLRNSIHCRFSPSVCFLAYFPGFH